MAYATYRINTTKHLTKKLRRSVSTSVQSSELAESAQIDQFALENHKAVLTLPVKLKLGAKKTPIEIADGLSPLSGVECAASTEANSMVTAGDTFIMQYAQVDSVKNDATGSSATPADLQHPTDISILEPEAGAATTSGFPTALWAGLGLLAVGGVTAIAISSSRQSGSTNSPDNAPPQARSMYVSGSTIYIVFSEPIDPAHLPSATCFNVLVGGVSNGVTTVSANGNLLELTLTSSVVTGSAIQLTYADPTNGNDLNAIQDLAGNDAVGFIQGTVADGYISGARIYIDANNNGIPEPSELLDGVVTDDHGNFFLPSNAPVGTIIAVGGVNIDTGLKQLTPMKAPAGSVTVNPLTHLIQSVFEEYRLNPLASNGQISDINDAANLVARTFGINLPSGVSLLNFNPLGGLADDGYSLVAQQAAAGIASLTLFASAGDQNTAFNVVNSLADLILRQPINGTIDLGDTNTLTTVLNDAGCDVGLANEIVVTVTAIQSATDFSGIAQMQLENLSEVTNLAEQRATAPFDTVLDNNAPETTLEAESDLFINQADFNAKNLAVIGNTEPFALVSLSIVGGAKRAFYADKNGNWRYQLTESDLTAVHQGELNLQAWTKSPSGVSSDRSNLTLYVDVVAPALSGISLVASSNSGSTNDLISNDTSPTFEMVAEKDAIVEVKDGSGEYRQIGVGTGALENYTVVNLGSYQGLHSLTFRATDAANNSATSTFNYGLDTVAPTIKIGADKSTLVVGETAALTFTFETAAPDHFGLENLDVLGGSLDSFEKIDSRTFKAIFTPGDGVNEVTNATVSLKSGYSYADVAGNVSGQAAKSILIKPAIVSLGDAPDLDQSNFKNTLVDGIVSLVMDMVGRVRVPFVADLAQVAQSLAETLSDLLKDASSELSFDWNDSTDTFGVTGKVIVPIVGLPLATDLGVSGLSFSVNTANELAVNLTCDLNLRGGYDTENGVFLAVTAPEQTCLKLALAVDVPDDLSFEGTLGPLKVTADNQSVNSNLEPVKNASNADQSPSTHDSGVAFSISLDLTNQAVQLSYEKIVAYLKAKDALFSGSVSGSISASNDMQLLGMTQEEISSLDNVYLRIPSQESMSDTAYTDRINAMISNRDNRLYWGELSAAVSDPSKLGDILDVSVDGSGLLSLHVEASAETGFGLVDAFIPSTSFDMTASISGSYDPMSNAYAYNLGTVTLKNGLITSDLLQDIVAPAMQTGEKLLSPIYPLVDFFYTPLPWKVETYSSTTPIPSGWDVFSFDAWLEYGTNLARDATSGGINGLITGLYNSLDLNHNGQVEFIEIIETPVRLANNVMLQGQEIIDSLKGLLTYAKDNAQEAEDLLTGDSTSGVPSNLLPFAGIFPVPIVGGLAAKALFAASDSLLETINQIELKLAPLKTLTANLNTGVDALVTVLEKVDAFRDLVDTLTANESNNSGVSMTMSGISLGDYSFELLGSGSDAGNNANTDQAGTLTTRSGLITSSLIESLGLGDGVKTIMNELASVGINLPILTEPHLLQKLVTMKPIDLLTYNPDLPTVELDFGTDVDLVALGQDIANLLQMAGLPGLGATYTQVTNVLSIFANLKTKFIGTLSIDPNIDFGIDTYGINSWFMDGMTLDSAGVQDLMDGFYLSDHVTFANNGSILNDAPELTIEGTLGLQNTLNVGWPFIGAKLDLITQLVADLQLDLGDPLADGKLRLGELLDTIQGETNTRLIQLDPDSLLSFQVKGEADAWLDMSKPLPAVDVLKSLGVNVGALNFALNAINSATSFAGNKYSFEIPFDAQWGLVGGSNTNAVIQV